jgi:hypothetical protein
LKAIQSGVGLYLTALLTLAPVWGWAEDEEPAAESDYQAPGDVQVPEDPCPPIDPSPKALLSAVPGADLDGAPFRTPSTKDFPKELAKNFRGLFTRRNLMPLIIGASATAGSAALDSTLRKAPANRNHFEAFGGLGGSLGSPGYLAAIFSSTFLAGQLAEEGRFKSMSYDLMQGYLLTTGLTSGLKHAIGRNRPNLENDLSFPSGHASTSFTYATILSHYYGLHAAIPAYAMAAFIGLSRVEKNAHNLSDVIAGMTLGYIVGRTVVHKDGDREDEELRFSWQPTVVPGGGGVSFAFSF